MQPCVGRPEALAAHADKLCVAWYVAGQPAGAAGVCRHSALARAAAFAVEANALQRTERRRCKDDGWEALVAQGAELAGHALARELAADVMSNPTGSPDPGALGGMLAGEALARELASHAGASSPGGFSAARNAREPPAATACAYRTGTQTRDQGPFPFHVDNVESALNQVIQSSLSCGALARCLQQGLAMLDPSACYGIRLCSQSKELQSLCSPSRTSIITFVTTMLCRTWSAQHVYLQRGCEKSKCTCNKLKGRCQWCPARYLLVWQSGRKTLYVYPSTLPFTHIYMLIK